MLRVLDADGEWGRPFGLAADCGGGAVYVSDERSGLVRRVTAEGCAVDVMKGLRCPQGLAASDARLFICETARGRVVFVNASSGVIDGTWDDVPLASGLDCCGQVLYAASAGSHAVFARDLRCPDDVRTIAGIPGSAGNMKYDTCGDGGDATRARLFSPSDVVVGPSGEIYISDSYNGRVRVVENGILKTVAGADQSAPRGNWGRATEINIGQPRGIAFSPEGLTVATVPGLVWQLDAEEQMMLPLVGTWVDGYNGDEGEAQEMRLNVPCGLAWLDASRLAIADSGNRRICLVEFP